MLFFPCGPLSAFDNQQKNVVVHCSFVGCCDAGGMWELWIYASQTNVCDVCCESLSFQIILYIFEKNSVSFGFGELSHRIIRHAHNITTKHILNIVNWNTISTPYRYVP